MTITATQNGIIKYNNNQPQFIRYDKTYQSKVKEKKNYSKRVQNSMESVELNIIQRQMYRRLIYGLRDFSEEQIKAMSPGTKYKIIVDYSKAKECLTIMKAKKIYKAETMLLNAIFPLKTGDRDKDWLLPIPKEYTLRKLGISVKDIINSFINKNLLPKNFFELSTEPQF